MNADSSTKFWLFLAVIVIGITTAFWPEITQTWETSVGGIYKDPVARPQLVISESELITGFRLGSIADGALTVSAQNLTTHKTSESAAELSFTLTSSRATSVYPSIKVFFVTADNRIARSLMLSSGQYAHGSSLRSETIALKVRILPGETGCTLQPFYPGS